MAEAVINWLLDGDVAIQYQARRDLLDEPESSSTMRALQNRIATEGWGARFLSARRDDGHWGRAFYQPKWTSSNYTLCDLKTLAFPPDHPKVRDSIHKIALEEKGSDGGINPSGTIAASDVCINGMFLDYACYFSEPQESLISVVDFVLSQHMADGGFNCRKNRSGAVHSSMHTTILTLEGIQEYLRNGYGYRASELAEVASMSREFLLMHRLYKSDRTGEVIRDEFLRFSFPPRWKYNVLRALDHFRASGAPWDQRMSDALNHVMTRRRVDGRWPLQAAHPGAVHFKMEEGRQPSRWNTLIAMRVLKRFGEYVEDSV